MENLEIIILLLFAITFLAVLSNRYNFPFPIVLLLVGILISFIPKLPLIILKPEVVFLVFLPPLLYASAWNTSWYQFKTNIRLISLAAIGLVFFTTLCVGIAAHQFIPGITWAEGFLLGAIVSPPDAVAATSVTRNLGLHPRLTSIIEGESLVNDASGLIAYKYALAAILTGGFSFWEAGFQFVIVITGGIAIGLLLGYCMYLIHKKFICDSTIEVTLTFLTPLAAYLLAENFHVSGVLAVVAAGLYLSSQSSEIFSTQSRIKTYAVWEVVMFILNGLIFILLGLQLKFVMEAIRNLSISELVFYGILISIVVILVRFIWVLPSAFLRTILSSRLKTVEGFDRRNIVVFAWAGMRGVVSMAAALAIPEDGEYLNRSLIIFLTFSVILFTLVVQGLSLPWVIRKLKIEKYSILAEEYELRMQIVNSSITHIEENLSLIDQQVLAQIKNKYEIKFNRLQHTDLPGNIVKNPEDASKKIFNQFNQLQLDLIAVEREAMKQLHKQGKAQEEIVRKIERELDFEEERIRIDFYN